MKKRDTAKHPVKIRTATFRVVQAFARERRSPMVDALAVIVDEWKAGRISALTPPARGSKEQGKTS